MRAPRDLPSLAAYRAISDQLDGQEPVLRNVNLADAKAHLSKLVDWPLLRHRVHHAPRQAGGSDHGSPNAA